MIRHLPLILFISIGATAAADYADVLQRESGLRGGLTYLPAENSSEDCLEGELVIRESAPNAASIRIGSNLLIDAIGPGAADVPSDEGCKIKRTSEPVVNGRIAGSKTMDCSNTHQGWKDNYSWKYVITVDAQGFTYSLGRNKKPKEVCRLIAQSPR
jgi:hypothetical protein